MSKFWFRLIRIRQQNRDNWFVEDAGAYQRRTFKFIVLSREVMIVKQVRIISTICASMTVYMTLVLGLDISEKNRFEAFPH